MYGRRKKAFWTIKEEDLDAAREDFGVRFKKGNIWDGSRLLNKEGIVAALKSVDWDFNRAREKGLPVPVGGETAFLEEHGLSDDYYKEKVAPLMDQISTREVPQKEDAPGYSSLGELFKIWYSPFVHAPVLEEAAKVGVPFLILGALNKYNPGIPVLNVGVFWGALVVFGIAFIALHVLNKRGPPGSGKALKRIPSTFKSMSTKEKFQYLTAPAVAAVSGLVWSFVFMADPFAAVYWNILSHLGINAVVFLMRLVTGIKAGYAAASGGRNKTVNRRTIRPRKDDEIVVSQNGLKGIFENVPLACQRIQTGVPNEFTFSSPDNKYIYNGEGYLIIFYRRWPSGKQKKKPIWAFKAEDKEKVRMAFDLKCVKEVFGRDTIEVMGDDEVTVSAGGFKGVFRNHAPSSIKVQDELPDGFIFRKADNEFIYRGKEYEITFYRRWADRGRSKPVWVFKEKDKEKVRVEFGLQYSIEITNGDTLEKVKENEIIVSSPGFKGVFKDQYISSKRMRDKLPEIFSYDAPGNMYTYKGRDCEITFYRRRPKRGTRNAPVWAFKEEDKDEVRIEFGLEFFNKITGKDTIEGRKSDEISIAATERRGDLQFSARSRDRILAKLPNMFSFDDPKNLYVYHGKTHEIVFYRRWAGKRSGRLVWCFKEEDEEKIHVEFNLPYRKEIKNRDTIQDKKNDEIMVFKDGLVGVFEGPYRAWRMILNILPDQYSFSGPDNRYIYHGTGHEINFYRRWKVSKNGKSLGWAFRDEDREKVRTEFGLKYPQKIAGSDTLQHQEGDEVALSDRGLYGVFEDRASALKTISDKLPNKYTFNAPDNKYLYQGQSHSITFYRRRPGKSASKIPVWVFKEEDKEKVRIEFNLHYPKKVAEKDTIEEKKDDELGLTQAGLRGVFEGCSTAYKIISNKLPNKATFKDPRNVYVYKGKRYEITFYRRWPGKSRMAPIWVFKDYDTEKVRSEFELKYLKKIKGRETIINKRDDEVSVSRAGMDDIFKNSSGATSMILNKLPDKVAFDKPDNRYVYGGDKYTITFYRRWPGKHKNSLVWVFKEDDKEKVRIEFGLEYSRAIAGKDRIERKKRDEITVSYSGLQGVFGNNNAASKKVRGRLPDISRLEVPDNKYVYRGERHEIAFYRRWPSEGGRSALIWVFKEEDKEKVRTEFGLEYYSPSEITGEETINNKPNDEISISVTGLKGIFTNGQATSRKVLHNLPDRSTFNGIDNIYVYRGKEYEIRFYRRWPAKNVRFASVWTFKEEDVEKVRIEFGLKYKKGLVWAGSRFLEREGILAVLREVGWDWDKSREKGLPILVGGEVAFLEEHGLNDDYYDEKVAPLMDQISTGEVPRKKDAPGYSSLGELFNIRYSPFLHAPVLEEAVKVGVPFALLGILNKVNSGIPVLNSTIFGLALAVFGVGFVVLHVLNKRGPSGSGKGLKRIPSTFKSMSTKEKFQYLTAPAVAAVSGLVWSFVFMNEWCSAGLASIGAHLVINVLVLLCRYFLKSELKYANVTKGGIVGRETIEERREDEIVVSRPGLIGVFEGNVKKIILRELPNKFTFDRRDNEYTYRGKEDTIVFCRRWPGRNKSAPVWTFKDRDKDRVRKEFGLKYPREIFGKNGVEIKKADEITISRHSLRGIFEPAADEKILGGLPDKFTFNGPDNVYNYIGDTSEITFYRRWTNRNKQGLVWVFNVKDKENVRIEFGLDFPRKIL